MLPQGAYQPPLSVAPAKDLEKQQLAFARQMGYIPRDVTLPSDFSNQAVSKAFWEKGATYTPVSFVNADGQTVSYYLTTNNDRSIPGDVFRGENKEYGVDSKYEMLPGIGAAEIEYERDTEYARAREAFDTDDTPVDRFVSRQQVLAEESLTEEEKALDYELRKLGEHGGLFQTERKLKERLKQNSLFGVQREIFHDHFPTIAHFNARLTKNLSAHVESHGFTEPPVSTTKPGLVKVNPAERMGAMASNSTCSELWGKKEPDLPGLEPRLATRDTQVILSGVDPFVLTRSSGKRFVYY